MLSEQTNVRKVCFLYGRLKSTGDFNIFEENKAADLLYAQNN